MNPDSAIVKVENGNTAFSDIDFTLTGLTPFDGLVVKIVMTSSNSCAVPIVKDLRIIACP